MQAKPFKAFAITTLLLLSTFIILSSSSITRPVYASPLLSLQQWPGMFASRSVLEIAGDSAPHGCYGVGAASADNLALADMASVVPGSATTQTRLDTEVMNFPGLTYKTGFTTQDVISPGGPVVNLIHCKYSRGDFAPAAAWFDPATFNIVTATGHSFSDPQGRHTMIVTFQDGPRQVLLAEGFKAYGTRAAAVILKNFASHTNLLQGSAVVFIPVDSNGNGFWEEGEGIQILEIVQQADMSATPTSQTVAGKQGQTVNFNLAVSETGGQGVGLIQGSVSVVNPTAGLSFSFVPNSWTVSAGGTTNIQGSVGIGASIAPGSYLVSLNVQARDASTLRIISKTVSVTVTVTLGGGLSIDPFWLTSIIGVTMGFGWPPGSVPFTGAFRNAVTITNTMSVPVLNLCALVRGGTNPTPQWVVDAATLGPGAGCGIFGAGPNGWYYPGYPINLPAGSTLLKQTVAGIPPDQTPADAPFWIRANTDDVGGIQGLERKTVYNIDGGIPISYLPFNSAPIRTAMTSNFNAAPPAQVSLIRESVPAACLPCFTSVTGVGVPPFMASQFVFVGYLYEDTMQAVLHGGFIDERLAVVFWDSSGGSTTYDTYFIDRNAVNSIVGEVPVNFAAGGIDDNAITMTGGFPAPLTVALWYLDVDPDNNGVLGPFGVATFVVANDIPAGPHFLGALGVAFNVDVEPVTAASPRTGVIGGALRTPADTMAPYNYYFGSLTLQGTQFFYLITIDASAFNYIGFFPTAPAPWGYTAIYADLDGDGEFEAVNSAAVVGEDVESFTVRPLAGPYGSDPGFPAGLMIPILLDDLPFGATGATAVEILQIVKVVEGPDFIPGTGDELFGTSTLTFPDPSVGGNRPVFAVGLGADNILGTADDVSFSAQGSAFWLAAPFGAGSCVRQVFPTVACVPADANDVPIHGGAGQLASPLAFFGVSSSVVRSLDNVVYVKFIQEAVGPVDWNQDGLFTSVFYALVVPRMSEAAYMRFPGTDLNGDGDFVDFVDAVLLNDPTLAPAAPVLASWWTNNTPDHNAVGLPFGSDGNSITTGYFFVSIPAIGAPGVAPATTVPFAGMTRYELWYISYSFGADGIPGTSDDSAGFGLLGDTSPLPSGGCVRIAGPPCTISTPGSTDNGPFGGGAPAGVGSVDTSRVSAPAAGFGSQSARSTFTTIWGTVTSAVGAAYLSGFSAGMTTVIDTPPALPAYAPMWTYFTGGIATGVDTFPLGGVPLGTVLAVVLRDSTTDGVFDTVVVDSNGTGGNAGAPSVVDAGGFVVGGQDSILGVGFGTGVLQVYQIISPALAAYQTSILVPAGPIGEGTLVKGAATKLNQLIPTASCTGATCAGGLDSRDLNQDGDLTDVWVLFSNFGVPLGNQISERYAASTALLPFVAGGPLDSPRVTAGATFVVSLFAAGALTEVQPLPGVLDDFDINNNGTKTDVFNFMLLVQPGTSNTNGAPFASADNTNRAVIDTDNDGSLANNVGLSRGSSVQFGANGWTWRIPGTAVTWPGMSAGAQGGIDASPDGGGAFDPDLVLAIPSGTYTIRIEFIGIADTGCGLACWVDTNGNGIPDWTDLNGNGVLDPGEGEPGLVATILTVVITWTHPFPGV